jgi:hypothetical protein
MAHADPEHSVSNTISSETTKRGRSRLREEALDEIAMLVRDGLALQLERGCESTVGYREIVGNELESADLLEVGVG